MTRLLRILMFLLVTGISQTALCGVEVHVDNPIDDDEESELHNLLKVTISTQGEDKWAEQAKKELAELERYSSIECTVQSSILRCQLRRFPIVRYLNFSGIPVLILERELQKHIPIRPGYVIKTGDSSLNEAVKRSEKSIVSYLERQGYFRAQVKTTFTPVSGAPASDILFEVHGGSFLKVQNVTLNSEIPIDPELVLSPFREMCASIRFAFEGIFQGTRSCYNKDIEREKINDIEDSLSYLGTGDTQSAYPEAHVSVEKNIIEDKDGKAHHLELGVNVLLGTKLEYDFEFVNAQYLDISDLVAFFRYPVEFFSRALNVASPSAIYPEDQSIIVNELRSALTFKSSHIVDDSQVQASIGALKEALRARGYANATVEVTAQEKRKGNVMFVKFRITPGNPAPLRSIKLIGSDLFSYKDVEAKESLSLSTRSLFSSGHLANAWLEHDRDLVRDFFKKEGYAEAAVKAIISLKSDGLELLYQVEPGPRRVINRVIFKGDDPKLTNAHVGKWAACKNPVMERISNETHLSCDPFPVVDTDLEDETLKLVTLYSQNGYLKATPKMSLSKEGEQVTVNFDFSGTQIKKARVAELFVDGNIATYRSVIERELGASNVVHGAKFKPLEIELGLRRLRSYNAYSKVMLEPIAKLDDSNQYYLFVQLIERPTLALDLNFSFDSDRLFGVTLGLEENNLFGTLLKLDTEFKFGLFIGRETKFSNIVTWRRFLGVPMNIIFNAPTLLYEQKIKSKNTEISERHAKLEASLGFEWQFLEHLRPSFEILLRVDQWQQEDSANPFSNQNFFNNPGASITSLDGLLDVVKDPPAVRGVLKPSLTYISLDDLFNPRFGYKIKGGFDISGSGLTSRFPYTIFNLEATGYVSAGPVTLAANFHLRRGLIQDPAMNWWVLKEEGDFRLLGGVTGPRSYDRDDIGIYGDIIVNNKPYLENGVVKKALHPGDFQFFASAELRFPLVSKLPFGRLDGAVFSDLGYIGICDTTFFCFNTIPGQTDPHQLGLSVGASLRWVLPVGPISIDYAVSPIHASPGLFGRESRISFQFGYIY